jgi:hypothetical protein
MTEIPGLREEEPERVTDRVTEKMDKLSREIASSIAQLGTRLDAMETAIGHIMGLETVGIPGDALKERSSQTEARIGELAAGLADLRQFVERRTTDISGALQALFTPAGPAATLTHDDVMVLVDDATRGLSPRKRGRVRDRVRDLLSLRPIAPAPRETAAPPKPVSPAQAEPSSPRPAPAPPPAPQPAPSRPAPPKPVPPKPEPPKPEPAQARPPTPPRPPARPRPQVPKPEPAKPVALPPALKPEPSADEKPPSRPVRRSSTPAPKRPAVRRSKTGVGKRRRVEERSAPPPQPGPSESPTQSQRIPLREPEERRSEFESERKPERE